MPRLSPRPRQRKTPHGHRHRATNGTAKLSLTIPTSRRVHAGASQRASGSRRGVGWPAASNRRALRYSRDVFRYGWLGLTVKRSDGAKLQSRVLSELAQVRVSVEWERPTWRVSWQDGPTPEALMGRAAALGGYRGVSGGCAAIVRGLAVRPQQFRCGDRGGVVGAGECQIPGSGPGGDPGGRGVLCGHRATRGRVSMREPWRPPSCCAG